MKQKIVIQIPMKTQKSRSKAMQIAVSISGVEKAALEGPGKDRIEVIGDGVDSVALAILLRRQFGSAELLGVSSVDEKSAEWPKALSSYPQSEIQYWYPGQWGGAVVAPPPWYYLETQEPHHENSSCSII